MDIVYEKMKGLVPIQNAVKMRDDGNFLTVESQDGELQYLNEVAKSFYLRIDGTKNIGAVIVELEEAYDVSMEELRRDMIELVRHLQWKGLILLREAADEA